MTDRVGNNIVPKRIQRSRAKGWRMPSNTVYVGRPTVFGNPFSSGNMTAREAVVAYRRAMTKPFTLQYARALSIHKRAKLSKLGEARGRISELQGKNLACWCPLDQPCHADVLLELANKRADL